MVASLTEALPQIRPLSYHVRTSSLCLAKLAHDVTEHAKISDHLLDILICSYLRIFLAALSEHKK